MIADILERLNRPADWRLAHAFELMDEAAAEIGRLRGEVAFPNPNVAVIEQARDGFPTHHPMFAALDHAAAELAVLSARDSRRQTPAPAMPNGVEAADVHLAAEMLTWGREEGLTVKQEAEVAAHAEKLFRLLRAADNRDAAGVDSDEDAFKNFHRSLCARFGYTHDEVDWRRDQVSLEEHIAKLTTPAAVPAGEAVALLVRDLRDAERLAGMLGLTAAAYLHQRAADALDTAHPPAAEAPAPAAVDLSNWASHYSINPAALEALRSISGPPAQVQAAPQEGEALDTLRQETWARFHHEWCVPGMPKDKQRLAEAAFICGASIAAHPSACELGAVVERHVADLRRTAKIVRRAVRFDKLADEITEAADELEAALQHRGDSRGGEAKS